MVSAGKILPEIIFSAKYTQPVLVIVNSHGLIVSQRKITHKEMLLPQNSQELCVSPSQKDSLWEDGPGLSWPWGTEGGAPVNLCWGPKCEFCSNLVPKSVWGSQAHCWTQVLENIQKCPEIPSYLHVSFFLSNTVGGLKISFKFLQIPLE